MAANNQLSKIELSECVAPRSLRHIPRALRRVISLARALPARENQGSANWPTSCSTTSRMCGRRNLAWSLSIVTAGFVACVDSSGDSVGSGTDAGAQDAYTNAEGSGGNVATSNDSGCIAPVLGASCAQQDAPCQPADRCCAGYEWFCSSTSNTWQKGAVGCPPPPACGEAGSSDALPSDTGTAASDSVGDDANNAPAADTGTAATDSGGDGSDSCFGPVTFHLAVTGSGTHYCNPSPCTNDFVSVLDANGQKLTIPSFATFPCVTTDCDACRLVDDLRSGQISLCTCDGGSDLLPAGGEDWTWDGIFWAAGGTCGSGHVACNARSCAHAGEYTVHVCVQDLGDTSFCGQGAPGGFCVDVPFTYPAQSTVVVTLP